ncbi:hypothetical protein TRFO_36074 [Tritrichomonas foetus]|uniref:Uncharacterized protein n=1 Tax=Tritrichomonas foetus TaxID=1144522 RepID=A0A1J4JJK4_9EUKA|nr:hypothetical protein TRFO_36074 [Tritrichomonas foetus]|eukprot:OHS97699.1 hypothetical protein TRFO_36074 [Tritrichomonas foetus]
MNWNIKDRNKKSPLRQITISSPTNYQDEVDQIRPKNRLELQHRLGEIKGQGNREPSLENDQSQDVEKDESGRKLMELPTITSNIPNYDLLDNLQDNAANVYPEHPMFIWEGILSRTANSHRPDEGNPYSLEQNEAHIFDDISKPIGECIPSSDPPENETEWLLGILSSESSGFDDRLIEDELLSDDAF